jgi:hypothetical protein
MKTTSHLGGRKAHTAKDRRVRYETSTKMMLGLMGVVRMVVALLHDWEGFDKCLVAGQVGAPSGAKLRTSCSSPTTAKCATSVMSTANRWKSPLGRLRQPAVLPG